MISCEKTKGPNVKTLLDEVGFVDKRRIREILYSKNLYKLTKATSEHSSFIMYLG